MEQLSKKTTVRFIPESWREALGLPPAERPGTVDRKQNLGKNE
jgi:hypothetical protein